VGNKLFVTLIFVIRKNMLLMIMIMIAQHVKSGYVNAIGELTSDEIFERTFAGSAIQFKGRIFNSSVFFEIYRK
jgi:hypothetical protein